MDYLVKGIKGYISHHGQRDPISREGTTISYFESLEAIKQWREHPEHLETQELEKNSSMRSMKLKLSKLNEIMNGAVKPDPVIKS